MSPNSLVWPKQSTPATRVGSAALVGRRMEEPEGGAQGRYATVHAPSPAAIALSGH